MEKELEEQRKKTEEVLEKMEEHYSQRAGKMAQELYDKILRM